MMTAQPGDRIQVHYRIRSQDGSTVSSRGRKPLEMIAGVAHRRLPGLGLALIGLRTGESTTVIVPPECGYGQSDPSRVRRWSRSRFPEHVVLKAGKLVRFTDDQGRRHLVRIVRVGSKAVLVDTNHRWAGQTLRLEVELIGVLGPSPDVETSNVSTTATRPPRSGPGRVVAFDVDAASLASLRQALPGWEIVLVNGSTVSSLARTWDPSAADLLVIGIGEDTTVTLALCRFVAFCATYSRDALPGFADTVAQGDMLEQLRRQVNAPLLVLVPPGHASVVAGALEAGAHSCLVLPIDPKEIRAMLARARSGNQPGRHTLNLQQAQTEDRWRDEGGEG